MNQQPVRFIWQCCDCGWYSTRGSICDKCSSTALAPPRPNDLIAKLKKLEAA